MATTSSNLVAGKGASHGGKGNNGQYGLKAKLTAGVAILGCAGLLIFGGAQMSNASRPDSAANPAVQEASNSTLSPIGRTGPSDEYLQADLANTLPIIQRTGPADEYTRAEDVVPSVATHGTGPADEYDR